MGLIETATLIRRVCPPLDTFLATQLVDEFVSLERRFIQRDWEPAQLDGGQFCEILGRIIYHQDSRNLNLTRTFEDCCKYIEGDQNAHAIIPRHNAIHLITVLKTIHKFRSQRGAVHVSPIYKANHMDAKLMIEGVRWCMNETLRLFWNGDRQLVARAIREILQFDVPCVGTFDDVILVQRTDLSVGDEILVLLHFAGEQGFTRFELGKHVMAAPPRVTEQLQSLSSPAQRKVVELPPDRYRLTDLGSKYVREHLAEKLLVE